jgi:hypothetical protein
MSARTLSSIGLGIFLGVGCAAVPREAPPPRAVGLPQGVEIVYRGERPFARRGSEEWSLGDLTRSEMRFSPDQKRFAYIRAGSLEVAHVLVRNLAGDPVNEFQVYKPGRPEALTWIDNRRLGYLAPADPSSVRAGGIYVIHDAETGEVLSARTGSDFIWAPDKKHVAFLSGAPGRQALVVDGKNVWPRRGLTHAHGEPAWSPDGRGLALVESGDQTRTPRLVVLVEYSDPAGDLTWPIPKDALASGFKVFWAGDSKVVIGESALRPKFAAGWERLK